MLDRIFQKTWVKSIQWPQVAKVALEMSENRQSHQFSVDRNSKARDNQGSWASLAWSLQGAASMLFGEQCSFVSS